MLNADIVGIGGIAFAVVGIIISIYYGRKALRQGKRELMWSREIIPLLSRGIEDYHSVVRISIAGEDVNDPHLVRLEVENTGKSDIESNSFDQNRPLKFIISETDFVHYIEPATPAMTGKDQSIEFGPELLPAGQSRRISFIVSGRPQIILAESYLINVNIRESAPTYVEIDLWTRVSVIMATLSALAAIVTVIAQFISNR